MAKSKNNEHPDVMRQQRFPLPGTDLGTLNARPMDFVPDVDLASCEEGADRCQCGHHGPHNTWDESHRSHMGQHTFAEPRKIKRELF